MEKVLVRRDLFYRYKHLSVGSKWIFLVLLNLSKEVSSIEVLIKDEDLADKCGMDIDDFLGCKQELIGSDLVYNEKTIFEECEIDEYIINQTRIEYCCGEIKIVKESE